MTASATLTIPYRTSRYLLNILQFLCQTSFARIPVRVLITRLLITTIWKSCRFINNIKYQQHKTNFVTFHGQEKLLFSHWDLWRTWQSPAYYTLTFTVKSDRSSSWGVARLVSNFKIIVSTKEILCVLTFHYYTHFKDVLISLWSFSGHGSMDGIEFNVWADPSAARAVFSRCPKDNPITVVPAETLRSLRFPWVKKTFT